MTNGSNGIREVNENDDFETISQLLRDNTDRFLGVKTISSNHTAEALRNNYCNGDPYYRGFIFEDNGKVVAFAGVTPLQTSKNGAINDWFTLENYEDIFKILFEQCVKIIQQRGGQKIFSSTYLKFGQIRSEKINFWQKLGFISDEYASASLTLDLDNWQEPDHFDKPNLHPALDSEFEDIIQMLIDDGNHKAADYFYEPNFHEKRHEHVILTLKEIDTDEIMGIVKYRAFMFNGGKKGEPLNASGFTVHLRPKLNPTQNQYRHVIQAALFSMKQLNIKTAVTNISLKDFDMFTSMIKEGFNNNMLMEYQPIRFYKLVNE